ncbi:Lrp/AsnC ligand binding domain-containing protein [Thalassospira alkalitolerans]|uniref:HTH asnC-type domain-containing protein n=1 Tax=Thalassospira alkalitolerans TaxID=1293890 RepID=A0A1Y2LBB1_9PROT|nr:Lrp/AsnC ligand binding domain-containing protein [Thalassospira alkalitolerans]OSQ47771.1 hypothetical protein TALK_12025 [Thalassospira alkalitolerans]|tara:strand:- start:45783 stop:46238 length:456 start_codon:yes stop_codon:yes gene_type:complete
MGVLDKIDLAVLREVAVNGRITVTDLAYRVGLSKTPCALRLRRLEESEHILGYRAILHPEKMGASHIAFVQVILTDTKTEALDAFNKAARAIPEIEQCHMIAGAFDYLIKVRSRDIGDYRRVLGEKISELPYVSHTSTFVVMEAVKDSYSL